MLIATIVKRQYECIWIYFLPWFFPFLAKFSLILRSNSSFSASVSFIYLSFIPSSLGGGAPYVEYTAEAPVDDVAL